MSETELLGLMAAMIYAHDENATPDAASQRAYQLLQIVRRDFLAREAATDHADLPF